MSTDPSTIAALFDALAAEWKEATLPLSSTPAITAHPSYRAVIALGWPAVPLILKDLEREPAHWFEALETITGANPIAPADWGKMLKMAAVWVAWGRQRGLI